MADVKFFPVEVSSIGETRIASASAEKMKGKIAKLDLSAIARGKGGEVSYVIQEVKDEKGFGTLRGMKLFPSYLKRFVRRGVTKIDDSFLVSLKSGKMRIKPVVLTRMRVKGAVETHIRKELRSFIAEVLKDKTSEEAFHLIFRGELQQKLQHKLKKIYPLAYCEIREVKLV